MSTQFLKEADGVMDFDSAVMRPGEYLALVRNHRGITEKAIVTLLKIYPRQLQALERDAYEDLPGQTFVIGILRLYSKQLGILSDPLVIAYRKLCVRSDMDKVDAPQGDHSLPASAKCHLRQNATKHLKRDTQSRRKWMSGIIVLGLSSVIAIWGWFEFGAKDKAALLEPVASHWKETAFQSKGSTEYGQEQMIETEVIEASVDEAPLIGLLSMVSKATVYDSEDGSRVTRGLIDVRALDFLQKAGLTEDNTELKAAVDLKEKHDVPVALNGVLELYLLGESWVEILDDSGTLLLRELVNPGVKLSVQLDGTGQVILGNHQAVRVFWQGNLINTGPHARHQVARFSVHR